VKVESHDAAGDICHDISMQALEVAKVDASLLQLAACLLEPLGQMAAQKGHKKKRDGVHKGLEERVSGIAPDTRDRVEFRPFYEPVQLYVNQHSVQDAARARQQQTGLTRETDGRSKDGEDVDKRKDAIDSAGIVDEGGDKHRVDPELEGTQPSKLLRAAQQEKIQDGQNTGATREDEEGSQREGEVLPNGQDRRRAQEEEGEEKPEADQPRDPRAQHTLFRWAIGIDVRHLQASATHHRHQLEDGQVHRDDDAADHHPKEDDHYRF